MYDPVFVIPEHPPQSYSDYFRLVELSGIETCRYDKLDFGRKAAFIYNFHGTVHIPKKKEAKTILWFLERPGNNGEANFVTFINGFMSDRNLDYIWFSDQTMQRLLPQPNSMFVPLGGDVRLGSADGLAKIYDGAHFSFLTDRRFFLTHLRNMAPNNVWGENRDLAIRQSKFLLNVHQDNGRFIEPLRFALAAAYAMPLLSEESDNSFPFVANQDYLSVPYSQFQDVFYKVVNEDYGKWKQVGERMRDRIIEYPFAANVLKAMPEIK